MSAALSRRSVLAAGSGLLVSIALPGSQVWADEPPLPGSLKETPLLDAWIRVGPDGAITAFTGKTELGQGLKTALIQIVAEQLDVAPARIGLVTADTARTPNEGFTAGSHSMQDSGTALLNAAAQTRLLLLDAAAAALGVAAETLTVVDGVVHAQGGATRDYGSLAAALSLHVRAQPTGGLKDPASYRVMGASMPRIDIPGKVTGGAAFIQDMRLPGMLHARAVRQPSTGAVLLRADTEAVGRLPGVVKVMREGSYLAVVAAKEWQAIKAMRALAASAEWRESATLPEQSQAPALIRSLPARDIPVLTWSNPAAPAVQRISARYTRPYQMHGAIGPSCALGAYLNIFAIESFVDELAAAAGADPVDFRLRHLTDERARDVIRLAADRFGWDTKAPREPDRGRGFAFARYKNLGAYCAVALNLSVEHETGQIRLGRVVAAVDSGQPINPDGIRNQIEGAMVQAASWTLYEEVRFDRRHITSTDWSGYPVLRFPAAPDSVEVHVLPRPGQPFLGTGEAGQGPMAAAIANALRDATGARVRDLPLSAERVKAAIGV